MSETPDTPATAPAPAPAAPPHAPAESRLRSNILHSQELDAIIPAVCKMQGELVNAARAATNPHFKKTYADLASVMDVLRKPLSDNGLCVMIFPATLDELRLTVTSRLFHSSGQWFEARLVVPLDRPGPQAMGSAITYARRYLTMALTGIVAEGEDDDANEANGNNRQQGDRRDERRQERRQERRDQGPQADQEPPQDEQPPKQRREKPKSEAPKKDKRQEITDAAAQAKKALDDDGIGELDSIRAQIDNAKTLEDLKALKESLQATDGKTPERVQRCAILYAAIRPYFVAKYDVLNPPAA